MTIIESLIQRFENDPDAIAVIHYESKSSISITCRELIQRALQYAEEYRARGVNAGDCILIVLKHSPELYYSFLGAIFCGAVPSFLPFPTPKQDPVRYWQTHDELCRRITGRLLVTYEENKKSVEKHIHDPTFQLCLAPLENERASIPSDLRSLVRQWIPKLSEDQIAFLQHSSGTTGLKKGVALSHRAVMAQVERYSDSIQLNKSDRIATWLPLYHDMGLITGFLLPIIRSIPVVALDPFQWVLQPEKLLEIIESHRCTFAWLPNFAFHHICRARKERKTFDLGSLRAIINCSEPCKAETFRQFASEIKGISPRTLQVCYAMAEAVFAATQTSLDRPVRSVRASRREYLEKGLIAPPNGEEASIEFLSSGSALPGVSVRIVDETRKPLAENCVGEIVLSADFLFTEYFRNPEATSKKKDGADYYTSDLGFLNNGELFVIGRADDVINCHGRKYSAHDIEFTVAEVPGVKAGRSIAFGLFRENVGSQEIVLLAEHDESSGRETADILNDIRKLLAAQFDLSAWDVRIVPPGWILKTTSGKLCRKENERLYLENFYKAE